MPHSNWRLQVLNLLLEVSSVSDKDSFCEFGQIVNLAGTKHCSQVIVLPILTDTNSTLQLYKVNVTPKHFPKTSSSVFRPKVSISKRFEFFQFL